MNNDTLVKKIYDIVKPFSEELNLEIYHIEYVKENSDYYLRIYIDKDGKIKLSDCEALSRRINDVLDEIDPIKEAYFLEVSSPGLNRGLYNDNHYMRFLGSEVLVKTSKAVSDKKSIKGILKDVNEESIIIDSAESEELINISKDLIKSVNIQGEI